MNIFEQAGGWKQLSADELRRLFPSGQEVTWAAQCWLGGWLASFGPDALHPSDNPEASAGISKLSYNMADAMIAEKLKRDAQ